MADFNINVVVNPSQAVSGSRRVRSELSGIESAADRVRTAISSALAFAGVAVGVRELVQLTDAFTNLQNRLRVVTSDQNQLTAATEEVFQIAQRTRSTFEGTAELYSRVSLAARDLGVSQQQTASFTESLNQAIILSGASAGEANAGLIQLSQGIASGALRGDELRSVLEQLPVVADVIAQRLDVTRGELRALGAEGRISAGIILDAFADAREELEERFGRTIPTISQSFNVLRNATIRLIGSFNESTGLASSLSSLLIDLANNIDTVARAAGALILVIGAQGLVRAVNLLTAALARNPLGLLAIAISTLIASFITFSDRISIATNSIVTLADVARATFSEISTIFTSFINSVSPRISSLLSSLGSFFENFNIGIQGFIIVAAQTADDLVELFINTFRAIAAIWEGLPATIDTVFSRAFNNAANRTEAGLNRIISAISQSGVGGLLGLDDTSFRVSLPRFEVEDVSTVRDLAQTVAAVFNEDLGLNATEQFVERILARARELAEVRQAAQEAETPTLDTGTTTPRTPADQTFENIIRQLQRENELLQLNSQEREIQAEIIRIENRLKRDLTATEEARARTLIESNQALERQNAILDDVNQPLIEYQQTLTSLNTLLEQGRISQEAFNVAIQQTSLAQGITDLQADLDPFGLGGEGAANQLRTQLDERLLLIQQAQEARLVSEQEALNLSLEANRAYHLSIMELEQERFVAQTTIASSTARSLAQITSGLVGEQSTAYQALFAISKGFAIADATVQIAGAIAKAANTPFPANLAAIATVAAQTASIVSTIQATNLTGFQNGGSFRVGGAGGTDSQLVQFMASPNETVSIRTPGQERQAAAQTAPQQQPEVRVNNVNVLDPSIVEDFLSSSQGEQVLVNSIQRNSSQVAELLRRV